jgi:hypothetical protein
MTMKKFHRTLVALLIGSAVTVQAASLKQSIASINADAQKPGGPERAMKSVSASTHVPVATLEKEKAKTRLSYGDLYAAHAIANASGKSFDQIAALKAAGQSWEKIAADNGVSLDGKKVAATTAPKPSPTAAPKKTLRQLQSERYSGQNSGL